MCSEPILSDKAYTTDVELQDSPSQMCRGWQNGLRRFALSCSKIFEVHEKGKIYILASQTQIAQGLICVALN